MRCNSSDIRAVNVTFVAQMVSVFWFPAPFLSSAMFLGLLLHESISNSFRYGL